MRLPSALLLVLLACGPAGPTVRSGGAGVRTWVEGQTEAGGVLVVQVEAAADVEVDVPEPVATGLTFQPKGDPRIERVGDHTVLTQRWTFVGSKGIYEVTSLRAPYSGAGGEGTLVSEPLWIDLGVPAPRTGELAGIAEPRRVFRLTWLEIAFATGVAAASAIGVNLLVRASRRPPAAEAPRQPAHVRALKAWEAVRADASVDDHAKTVALSRIFREYMEEVLRFPATAWTTTETLAHLQGLSFLPEGNVGRAKRLLRATDRVKFADAAARQEMFVELDADLRAFLDHTRPRAWQAEEVAS